MRIGFIGTGHIAAPMARFLARKGHEVTVSERNFETAAELSACGLGIQVAQNQTVVDGSEIVILCLRPAVWKEIMVALKFGQDHRIVSVMAGVPLADIRASTGIDDVSATIPYGFLETGGCPLPVAGDPTVVNTLFAPENYVLPQAEEKFLQFHFAASALASGILEMLEVSTSWLAGKTGGPDQAEVYVGNLISGVLNNLEINRAGVLAAERNALASPKTLNLQMVEGLRKANAFDHLPRILSSISASMDKEK